MVIKGDCDYVASQDFDCLIYGAPVFVKNLSISNKKKKINALTYEQVKPEMYELSSVLKDLGLSIIQLRALAILIGTDFNVGGVKGLGPKKALKLVKECKEDLEEIFSRAKYEEFFETSWKEVYELISNMPIKEDYVLEWTDINKDEVINVLVDKHDFSKERVLNKLEELEKQKTKSQQTNLGTFF
jgi:flap endonuclease-1